MKERWTEQHEAHLAEMWRANFDHHAIAKTLSDAGRPTTRDAVMARIVVLRQRGVDLPSRSRGEPWSKEADAILEAGYEAKKAARDIAADLIAAGFKATRNSVLGRLFRKGLTTPAPEKPEKPKACIDGPTGCRFIFGEPSGWATKWCDAPVSEIGGSWCPIHRAKVYQERNSEDGNTVPPQAQRSGTVALFPTISPMRVVA